MVRKRIGLIIWITVICVSFVHSQNLIRPNYGLKSHETLEISKVETTPQKTVIFLSVENRRADGSFCADKNIYIIYPDGSKSKMVSSKGIPECPEIYRFKEIGEKLSFALTFPSLKVGNQWIDLVEECSENCFSFYGVCLNNDLNRNIDDAASLAENKQPAEALVIFLKIASVIDSMNSGIEGLIYINIIQLAKDTGNIPKATEWYRKLESSVIPRKELYIKYLNSQGIIY